VDGQIVEIGAGSHVVTHGPSAAIARGMFNEYRTESTLSEAFDDLLAILLTLDRAWTCQPERAALRHAAGDVRHHICAVIWELGDLARHAEPLRPCSRLDTLGEGTRVLAHEGFLSVLSLGQLLRRALEDDLAPAPDVAVAQLAVSNLLDELTPYIAKADDLLRWVLLEQVPVDDGVRDHAPLDHAPLDHAPFDHAPFSQLARCP